MLLKGKRQRRCLKDRVSKNEEFSSEDSSILDSSSSGSFELDSEYQYKDEETACSANWGIFSLLRNYQFKDLDSQIKQLVCKKYDLLAKDGFDFFWKKSLQKSPNPRSDFLKFTED